MVQSLVVGMNALPNGSRGVGVVGIDPTPEELATIVSRAKAVEWGGLGSNAWSGSANDLGGPNVIREITMLPATAWEKMLDTKDLVISADGPTATNFTPMDKSRLISLRRVCRLRCGLAPGEAVIPPPADFTLVPSSSNSPVAPAVGSGQSLSLDIFVDQTLKIPLVQFLALEVRKMSVDYENTNGASPSDDTEPTSFQLSALAQLFAMDLPPYVDYALWGPHGRRLLHRLTFVAMVPLGDGTSQREERAGPASFDLWWGCHRVYRAGAMLLTKVSAGPMDAYANIIRKLQAMYPWYIVYTADVRMRSERFEKIRRRLESAHAAGLCPKFDTNAPWDLAFIEAAAGKDLWDDNVREPSMLYYQRRNVSIPNC